VNRSPAESSLGLLSGGADDMIAATRGKRRSRSALGTAGMFECGWIEGTRTFNIIFGATTSAVCFGVAIPMLWWVLPGRNVWFFPRDADCNQGVQLAYGIFCMSMAFTDALCRFIPHKPLAWVHPAFFFTTLIIAGALGPRIVYLLLRSRRTDRQAISAFAPNERPQAALR
jgi:hypothetical protein